MANEWALIGSAYCLNLDRNYQRWIDSEIQFHNVGLEVERINCIEGENRFLSFNQSHYSTVKKGFETGKPFAIFEDDVAFDPIWKHIAEASRELPDNWDALYLGCNFISQDWQMPYGYSNYLCKLPNAWMTHAIIYSMAGAKFVLDNFRRDEISAENPVFDEWLRVNLMPRGNVYLLNPMNCYQRPGYSDVWQTNVEYGTHGPGNKWLKLL